MGSGRKVYGRFEGTKAKDNGRTNENWVYVEAKDGRTVMEVNVRQILSERKKNLDKRKTNEKRAFREKPGREMEGEMVPN